MFDKDKMAPLAMFLTMAVTFTSFGIAYSRFENRVRSLEKLAPQVEELKLKNRILKDDNQVMRAHLEGIQHRLNNPCVKG